MFGYARNSGIHWLRNYGDALHKYESTTDIRGRTEEPKRPLGHRKSVDMYSIVKLDNGDIQCVLYKTPVVTFHTDNTVTIKDDSWASQTTANFIPEVMGGDVYARVFDAKICLTVCGDDYFLPRGSSLKLSKTEHGNWQVDNPPNNVIHHINRKESKQVLAKYKDFFSYLERMQKLRFDGEKAVFSEEEFVQTFGKREDGNYINRTDCVLGSSHEGIHLVKFKEYISDTSEAQHVSYYKAMLILVNTVAWVDWHTEERRMKQMHWVRAVNEAQRAIWGYHRDEVFKEVPVAKGVVKKDAYEEFFRGGWQAYHKLTLLSSSETTQKNT